MARYENLVAKVCHMDAYVAKSQVTEQHQNKQKIYQLLTLK